MTIIGHLEEGVQLVSWGAATWQQRNLTENTIQKLNLETTNGVVQGYLY